MRFYCTNTVRGLVPNYDADYDEKKKLKIGEVYSCEIKLARNYEFHKKYFALIACAWEYQNEARRAFFKENKEAFRKTIEIQAGWFDEVYSIQRNEWVQTARSISFEKMTEDEFQNLYDRVKDVLFATFLTHITVEEFNKKLVNF